MDWVGLGISVGVGSGGEDKGRDFGIGVRYEMILRCTVIGIYFMVMDLFFFNLMVEKVKSLCMHTWGHAI